MKTGSWRVESVPVIMDTRPIKVLIIDDSETDRYLIRHDLESASTNYDVHEAGNGQVGLALSKQLQPDCILLDLRLGAESGYDVLNSLVGLERPPKIPVIILTGMAWEELEQGARCLGASGFLVKTRTESATLDAAIRHVISTSHPMPKPE